MISTFGIGEDGFRDEDVMMTIKMEYFISNIIFRDTHFTTELTQSKYVPFWAHKDLHPGP